jgi:ABC-type transport system substrate-binding protein
MKTALLKGLSVIMMIGLLLTACGQSAPVAEATTAPEATEAPAATEAPEVSGGVLTVGMPIEPETLDPGDAVYVQEQFIAMNLFDSLLSISPDGSAPWSRHCMGTECGLFRIHLHPARRCDLP